MRLSFASLSLLSVAFKPSLATDAPTRSPIQFGSLFTKVGDGTCIDKSGQRFSEFLNNEFPGGEFDCGVWCSQNILPGFVGFELYAQACRCLFSGDAIPNPPPTYHDPTAAGPIDWPGTGIVSSYSPSSYGKCYKYNAATLSPVTGFPSTVSPMNSPSRQPLNPSSGPVTTSPVSAQPVATTKAAKVKSAKIHAV